MLSKVARICMLVVLMFVLVACAPKADLSESGLPTASAVIETQVSIEVTSVPEDLESKWRALPLSEVVLDDNYEPSFEYLELGDNVDYCQRTWDKGEHEYVYGFSLVRLFMSDKSSPNGSFYEYKLVLDPPHYRALKSALGEDYQGNYFIEVKVIDGVVLSIGDILDSSDNVVWNSDLIEAPRELTAIESAFLLYRSKIYHVEPENFIDIESEAGCASFDDSRNYFDFKTRSPLEYRARESAASSKYFHNSGTWLFYDQEGYDLVNCDVTSDLIGYKWLNSDGELLLPIDCHTGNPPTIAVFSVPEDGWIVLEKWVNTKDGPAWKTVLETEIYESFLVNALYYNAFRIDDFEYFDGNTMSLLVDLTESWSDEEVIKYLSNPFGE